MDGKICGQNANKDRERNRYVQVGILRYRFERLGIDRSSDRPFPAGKKISDQHRNERDNDGKQGKIVCRYGRAEFFDPFQQHLGPGPGHEEPDDETDESFGLIQAVGKTFRLLAGGEEKPEPRGEYHGEIGKGVETVRNQERRTEPVTDKGFNSGERQSDR